MNFTSFCVRRRTLDPRLHKRQKQSELIGRNGLNGIRACDLVRRRVRKGIAFYRGRPGCQPQGEPYAGADIGAPPAAIATAGRANRTGAPVLYSARNEKTAIAELRARTPEGLLSVCRLRATRDLNVIDIVDGYPRINPFTSSEERLGCTAGPVGRRSPRISCDSTALRGCSQRWL